METSIGRAFETLARRDPDRPALVVADVVVTRGELDAAASRLARRWVADGLMVDDVVAVGLPNGVDVVVALVAAWKAGATPLPMSPRLPAAERDVLLDLARPRLVVDAALGPVDDPGGSLPDLAASCWKAATSSGSTGAPKIVRAAASAHLEPEAGVAAFVPREAIQLVSAPVLHAAPFVYAMRGLMTGHTLVLMPEFDPDQWLRLVERHRVTWAVLSPATMTQIIRSPVEVDLSSLDAVLHVGSRCPVWLKQAWIDRLGAARVDEVYAGTESQGVAYIGGQEWLEHPGSVGRGVGGSEFRVVRADGTGCDAGELGEIVMRRDRPTYSYLGASPTVRDGWHTLGDAGWLDADGYLYVGDRLADRIDRPDGSVVWPADLEAVLEEHLGVVSALVVERDGELCAVVEGSLDGLAPWLEARLPPNQRPARWLQVDGPLRDETGKANRSAWRRVASDGEDRGRGDDLRG